MSHAWQGPAHGFGWSRPQLVWPHSHSVQGSLSSLSM